MHLQASRCAGDIVSFFKNFDIRDTTREVATDVQARAALAETCWAG